ncbi:hypothetical protein [Halalkalicoccus salilacus]|uniref:hypothetical protein n=1 Tax=Halalkalicoccus TaxID=332246 RepID=UPI002F961A0B
MTDADDLRDSYDDIKHLLDDFVELFSNFDHWEEHDGEHWIEGDRAIYGPELTRRLLKLGYVPASCSGGRLVVSPIDISLDTDFLSP